MAAIDSAPRIALIHALDESVAPARAAFAELWPEAYCFDLLDTSLAVDLASRGRLDTSMIERFHKLSRYACASSGRGGTAAGLLFTCSAFGDAIDSVKAASSIPVLRPNEAAFEAALERGSRLGLVVTFEPSFTALQREMETMAKARGQTVVVKSALAEGALAALKRGDGVTHDRLAAEAASTLDDVDAIILGQFSLARARDAVARATGVPVITTPHSAVRALRRMVSERADNVSGPEADPTKQG